MDTKEMLRARFWELKAEIDELEPEITAARKEYDKVKANSEAKLMKMAEAFKAREDEVKFWAKKQELADIAKFLRDPVTGVAKMGPRPN